MVTGKDSNVITVENLDIDTASSYSDDDVYAELSTYVQMIALNASGIAGVNTEKPVKLDNYNSISLDIGMYNNNSESFKGITYFGISKNKDSSLDFDKFITYENSTFWKSERKTLTLDVSDITGQYYIKIIAQHPSNVSYYGYYNLIYSLIIEK